MIGLLRRNAVFIYLSFLVTGLTSIAPQRLFAAMAPETAEAWVAGTLLIGTVASIIGVSLSDRFGLTRRPVLVSALLIVVMTGALVGSFGVPLVIVAALLQVIARFLANYAKQDFDRRAVVIAGPGGRVENDRVVVTMRFIGMLLGPLWFGAFHLSSWMMLSAVAALMLVSLSSVRELAAAPVVNDEPVLSAALLQRPERVFAALAIGIYATYYLLASNIVYMLAKSLESSRASGLGGILITTVYATAMLTSMWSARRPRRHLSLLWVLPAPILMLAAGPMLQSSWVSVTAVLFAGATVLGIGFAFYLLAVRNHITGMPEADGARWLAFYNNLANTSALVAFCMMAILVGLSRLFEISYASLFSAGLSALALATIAGVVSKESQSKGSPND